jgi:hypothetical protein
MIFNKSKKEGSLIEEEEEKAAGTIRSTDTSCDRVLLLFCLLYLFFICCFN